MANTTWPDTCKDAPLGRECKGQCAQGFRGEPTAVCTKKGWSANGGCKPQTCDTENLPQIANATWDCGLPAPRHHDDDDHEKDDDHEGDDDHEEDDDHQDVLLGESPEAGTARSSVPERGSEQQPASLRVHIFREQQPGSAGTELRQLLLC